MRKSFKDSLKVLEADVQHANSLVSDCPRDHEGACIQMRVSYSPAAHFFLFLVQWGDCHLADGTATMCTRERKASIREFYGTIYPSLMQLQKGISDTECKRQTVCSERYHRKDEDSGQFADTNLEREEECGICMEMNSIIVLPSCHHVMCLKCYHDWRTRSHSCPFCRNSLKRANSGDLRIYTDTKDIRDMTTLEKDNNRRLYQYMEELPLVVPDHLVDSYHSHIRLHPYFHA